MPHFVTRQQANEATQAIRTLGQFGSAYVFPNATAMEAYYDALEKLARAVGLAPSLAWVHWPATIEKPAGKGETP